jgi:hypothetical protein
VKGHVLLLPKLNFLCTASVLSTAATAPAAIASPSDNSHLNQQFLGLLRVVREKGMDAQAIQHFIMEEPFAKESKLDVQFNSSRWPAAYQPDRSNLIINPSLLGIGKNDALCAVYAVTEIFDQLIYAQLHLQSKSNDCKRGIYPNATKDVLDRLLKIKADKQEDIKASVMGVLPDAQDAGDIVDPYSAWLIASPRYASETDCVKAFEQAVSAKL